MIIMITWYMIIMIIPGMIIMIMIMIMIMIIIVPRKKCAKIQICGTYYWYHKYTRYIYSIFSTQKGNIKT